MILYIIKNLKKKINPEDNHEGTVFSVLSQSPNQGIKQVINSNGILLSAAEGSFGTGRYKVSRDLILKSPLYTRNIANVMMNTLEIITDGRSFSENWLEEKNDTEIIVEIKFSDFPVIFNNDGETSSVEFGVGQEFDSNGIKYRVMDAAGNLSAISLLSSPKKVNIPDSVEYAGFTLNVVDIAQNFMKGNKKVQNVTIGANVTAIGKCAFYNCKKLKKVTVKNEIKTVFLIVEPLFVIAAP